MLMSSGKVILAHDCSGLTDCYDAILAALLVLIALLALVALLWYFGPFLLRFAVSLALRGRYLTQLGRYLSQLGRNAGPRLLQAAREGGRHAGTVRNYSSRSASEIAKAIRSYRRQVQIHADKLRNPRRYVENWDRLRPSHRRSLLRRWVSDATRNAELAEILEALLATM